MVPARPTDASAPTFPPPLYEPLSSPLCNSGDSAPVMGVGWSSGPMPWIPDTEARDRDGDLPPVLQQAAESQQATTAPRRRC